MIPIVRLPALLVCLFLASSASAQIFMDATVRATGLRTDPVMAYSPFEIRPYGNLDAGRSNHAEGGFTSDAEWSSLIVTFGDLEWLGTSFLDGCTPTPEANCPSATNHWGDTDGALPFMAIRAAGLRDVLVGTVLSLDTTTNTTYRGLGDSEYGKSTGFGMVRFTGGRGAYFDGVMALTGGTGLAEIRAWGFNGICVRGSDPCGYSMQAVMTLVPEPTTAVLVAAGLACLASGRERSAGAAKRRRERIQD